MAYLVVRVPDELVPRLDAWAGAYGGRAPAIRGLILQACGQMAANSLRGKLPSRPVKFGLNLTPEDAQALRAAADHTGLTRSAWIAALIRARLRRQPTFDRSGDLAMIGIQRELRAIGVRLDAHRRAIDGAVPQGPTGETVLQALEACRHEVRGQLSRLREVMAGNLAYWEALP